MSQPLNAHGPAQASPVAYFSMEIGLRSDVPTYSGGLGVLAGDTLRAAADRGLPVVGISLLYRRGYFKQTLDEHGIQYESPEDWSPEAVMTRLEPRVAVRIEGRDVQICAWEYRLLGARGHSLPVLFLDAAVPENSPEDRQINDFLYGGDTRYRLIQEAVLGLGGVAMLRALGYSTFAAYHMNEGHSALLGIALLQEQMNGVDPSRFSEAQVEKVRRQCVFTTHTPVPAGHDQFPMDQVRNVLGPDIVRALEWAGGVFDGRLNMTHLALSLSRYINGVSMRHEEISRGMFPNYPVNSITNGVHATTWLSPHLQELFDRHFPEWRLDNRYLRHAIDLDATEVAGAHRRAKDDLIAEVESRAGRRLNPDAFTMGFARRATPYKRSDLIFHDQGRFRRIAERRGPLQVIFAGKAHPRDHGGKALIQRIFRAADQLKDVVEIVYLPDYDMELARVLVSGVDLWLNTPLKPEEASGTSGMKAALNGVPSLSVLDGWWVEGCIEGVTGWSIGSHFDHPSDSRIEAESLYHKLEDMILPMFYAHPLAFAEIRRNAIALNASFFNAERMLDQYVQHAYALS